MTDMNDIDFWGRWKAKTNWEVKLYQGINQNNKMTDFKPKTEVTNINNKTISQNNYGYSPQFN